MSDKPKDKAKEDTPLVVPARTLDEKLDAAKATAPVGKGPQDVAGVKTLKDKDIVGAPRRIRVWEGGHSAEAVIVQNNEDDTFDLSADIWGNGQQITLIGVARRQGGQGNGWEEIDAEAEAAALALAPHDERAAPTTRKVALDYVRLHIAPAFNGQLVIDHSTYHVTGGVVEVPPWHADAARAAGYQG
jgi:hypothetical protein